LVITLVSHAKGPPQVEPRLRQGTLFYISPLYCNNLYTFLASSDDAAFCLKTPLLAFIIFRRGLSC
jgi:hypothetical protein